MQVIETVHSEPRDVVNSPGYRVDFWQPTPQGAWALDANALLEAQDLDEVLRWIEVHAAGRRFELFAEMDAEPAGPFTLPRQAGLIRLMGRSPNEEYGVTAPAIIMVPIDRAAPPR